MDVLEFVLKMKDMMSGSMARAAASTQSSINTTARSVAALQRRMGDTSSITAMERAMRMLERRRRLSVDTSEISRANNSIQTLQSRINQLNRTGIHPQGGGSGGGGGMMGMMGSMAGGNLIASAITQGLRIAKDAAVDTYKTSLKNSSLTTAINSTTGGKGAEAIARTSKLADKYGLNYEASLEGVKTLTGGLKGLNLPLQKQFEIFEGVSTGIAAMKVGSEESKGAFLALGQMASKGTVSAEELRGQLGERIPGAFGIAARAMNMTEAQLGKFMQKGEIAAKDFLPRFAAEMQKTFGADALAAAKGPQAIAERWDNAVYKMKATIGDSLMPAITPFMERMTELASGVMPSIKAGIDNAVTGFKTAMNDTNSWGGYVAVVKDHMSGFLPIMGGIWGKMTNVMGGMLSWIGHSQILKDVFSGVLSVVRGVFSAIGWIVDKVEWMWDNILKPILNGIETAYGWVKELIGADNSITVKQGGGNGGNSFFGMPNQQKPFSMLLKPNEQKAAATSSANGIPGTSKSDGISSGGPRVININIQNLIEGLTISSMNVREGVNEMGRMIQEEVRRALYSAAAAQ